MQLSVIIVNWNSKDYVRQCLASLFAHCQSLKFEVIVVDGASYDGCGEMLAREFPSVVFIQSPENVGFARANNLGARHATGRYLLLLNPDTLLHEDSLRVLFDHLESEPKAGAAGCRLLNRDRTLQTSCVQAFPTVVNQMLDSEFLRNRFPNSKLWGIKSLYASPAEPAVVEALSGACIMIRKDVFERIGGFTKDYFMYGEDLDLCFKVNQAGHAVYYLPNTSLVHFGGGSSSKAASEFSTVMMRNSVCHFLRINRSVFHAFAYRCGMAFTSVARLLLMAPLMLFGNRVVRHGTGSGRKWYAVLRWSLGIGLGSRPKIAPRQTANVSN